VIANMRSKPTTDSGTGSTSPAAIIPTYRNHEVRPPNSREGVPPLSRELTAAIDGNVVHRKAEGLQCTRCHNSVDHSESASAGLILLLIRSHYGSSPNDGGRVRSRRLFLTVLILPLSRQSPWLCCSSTSSSASRRRVILSTVLSS
jgi:hypothetical protein